MMNPEDLGKLIDEMARQGEPILVSCEHCGGAHYEAQQCPLVTPQYEHNQLVRVFQDDGLQAGEKLVMLAIFVMGTTTHEQLGKYCELSPHMVRVLKENLMVKDWLAGPEG